jgi:Flp pilus assembly protein TadG
MLMARRAVIRAKLAAAGAWIRRAAADRRGVSFVEFAFIAPVLLIAALGIADVTPAIEGEFHVDHANESTADMAAEYTEMQASDMVNVLSVPAAVLQPLPTTSTNPTVQLTNVYTDGAGNAKVYWSCGLGVAPMTANSNVTSQQAGTTIQSLLAVSLPGAANTSFVMSQITYTYKPITGSVLTSPITMRNTAYLLPRQTGYVGFLWDGVAADAPTKPTSTTKVATVTLSNGAVCSYAQ